MSDSDSDNGSKGSYKIKTQLDGVSNYEVWMDDIKILWEEKGVLEHLVDKKEKPVAGVDGATEKDVKKWKKRDVRSRRCIRSNCNEGPLGRLQGCTTGLDMLERLQQAFGLLGFTLIQGFLQIISTLSNANDSSVDKTVNNFLKANQGLEQMKVALPIPVQISFFLSAFQHTYSTWYNNKRGELTKLIDPATQAVNMSKDTLNNLIREITDHASIVKPDKSPHVHRNWTDSRNAGNGQQRRFTSWRDHFEGDGCVKKCSWCIREKGWLGHGHTEEECHIKDPYKRRNPPQQQRPNTTSNTDSNLPASDYIPQRNPGGEDGNKKLIKVMDTKTEDRSENKKRKIIAIARAYLSKQDTSRHDWQYDTAASIHVCNNKSSFVDFDETNQSLPYVLTLGGYVIPRGIGTVHIKTAGSDGRMIEMELGSVFYMPESLVNLLLRTKLLSTSYYFDTKQSVLVRMSNNKELARIDFDREALTLKLHRDQIEIIAA